MNIFWVEDPVANRSIDKRLCHYAAADEANLHGHSVNNANRILFILLNGLTKWARLFFADPFLLEVRAANSIPF
jgi:hypothetical protein